MSFDVYCKDNRTQKTKGHTGIKASEGKKPVCNIESYVNTATGHDIKASGEVKPVKSSKLKSSLSKKVPLKPFVKWAGGKGQLLAEIRKSYPVGMGDTIKKYAEPFVGGGAVLFDLLSSYSFEKVYISDVNAELINTYRIVRDEAENLIELLLQYEKEYIPMDDSRRKSYYYTKRKRFNDLKTSNAGTLSLESAALFIFLNRTCYNGLYRVNRKGLFNVPVGSYKKPVICDAGNLMNISCALKNVEIVCDDYKKSFDFIDNTTFVYFDPPYRPLNPTSSFTSYSEDGFDDMAQRSLAEYVTLLTKVGAKVIVSNSDPKNQNPKDNFFEELYKNFNIKKIKASRNINSKSAARGKISELLICNF